MTNNYRICLNSYIDRSSLQNVHGQSIIVILFFLVLMYEMICYCVSIRGVIYVNTPSVEQCRFSTFTETKRHYDDISLKY